MRALADWIDFHAARTPDHPALIHGETHLSYRDLAARSAQLAAWLQHDCRLVAGERVAWLGHNAPDLIALVFACARCGLLLLPLNWRLGDNEIAGIVADAEVALALLDISCRERAAAVAGVPLAAVGHVAVGARRCPSPAPPAAAAVSAAAPDRPVLLIYTSGTTGRAKGAVLTQRAVEYNALNAVHMHDLCAADRVLTVLPMFHVGGLNIQTLPALYCGATVILEARFEAGRTLDLIASLRPTLTLQVPSTLAALLEHPRWPTTDLSTLRCIATGSTDVPVHLIKAIHMRGVPVIQIYGATETGPVAIYQRIEQAYATLGSIGRPGLHTEIRLCDERGNVVSSGVAGEIQVRGAHVACGYWDRTRLAAQSFADGWFASGDIAQCDANGDYWFKDRRTHVIISGGENIYPAELERVLADCALLREAAVAGRPDRQWGEVPVVVAVRVATTIGRGEVLRLFDGRLARYKHPRDVVFVDALPRTALGKVEVSRLRELVRDRTGGRSNRDDPA